MTADRAGWLTPHALAKKIVTEYSRDDRREPNSRDIEIATMICADLAAERAAAAEAMREACAEACDGHAETLALNAIGGLAVVAARTSAAIIRSLPIPSASALAERDERMREDGRREAFVKTAEHLRRVALSYDRNGANQAAGGALRGEAEFIEMLAAETRARSEGKP